MTEKHCTKCAPPPFFHCKKRCPCHKEPPKVCGTMTETASSREYCQYITPCPIHTEPPKCGETIGVHFASLTKVTCPNSIPCPDHPKEPEARGWEAIKNRYSQSGLFDIASSFEKELDNDVASLLSQATDQAKREGEVGTLEWVLAQFKMTKLNEEEAKIMGEIFPNTTAEQTQLASLHNLVENRLAELTKPK